jgi:hypothetical protein
LDFSEAKLLRKGSRAVMAWLLSNFYRTTVKKNKIIFVIVSFIIGIAIGLIAGIMIISPRMSLTEAVGTIGRLNQYRNVRITEADIELRNELLSDEEMLEAYRSYLAFEYSANLRMVEDLNTALQAGRDIPEFSSKNAHTLDRLESYAGYLENARLTILDAMGALSDLSGQSRVAVRSLLNNAGNAIVQSHSLSSPVFDFMLGVDSYLKQNPEEGYKQLANAHDQLLANLMMINIINRNLPVLEYLTEKSVLAEDLELAQFDSETLRSKLLEDVGRLEGIVFHDAEKLNTILLDTERLSVFFDAEALSLIVILAPDAEKLSVGFTDTDKLSAFTDAERLSGIIGLDSERLNVLLSGSQKLNLLNLQYI